jgi:hypothetical protein
LTYAPVPKLQTRHFPLVAQKIHPRGGVRGQECKGRGRRVVAIFEHAPGLSDTALVIGEHSQTASGKEVCGPIDPGPATAAMNQHDPGNGL